MCGRVSYVDETRFSLVNEAIKMGWDNPFSCEICEEEYNELSSEG